MKHTLLLAFTLLALYASGQVKDRQPVQAPALREADVVFAKRVWRVMDLREKQNSRAMWPGAPLNRILYTSVTEGKLKPYASDSLKSLIALPDFMLLGTEKYPNKVFPDPNDDSRYTVDTIVIPFNAEEHIEQVMLMEDWYFDKKHSSLVPRIIALAPLFNLRAGGYDIGLQPLCWLKFDEVKTTETDCRDVLSKIAMFNKENSRSQFTYDDWFQQRQFSSYIVKISNMHDMSISNDPEVQKNGLRALMESEKLKRDQREMEASQFED
jgi:gliding motility associated protien GldN